MLYRGIGRLFALVAAAAACAGLAYWGWKAPQNIPLGAAYAGAAAVAALIVLFAGALLGPRAPWPFVSGVAAVWSVSAAVFFALGIERLSPLPLCPSLILAAGLPGAVALYWLLFVPKGALARWTLGPALALPAAWIGAQIFLRMPGFDFAHGAQEAAMQAGLMLAVPALIWLAFRLLDRLFRPLGMA